MSAAARPRRFQFSLRTLAWLALVIPLTMFAAWEHHQRTQLERKLQAVEMSNQLVRDHNAALVREYHALVDKQQHVIQRYNNLITRP
jgi:hypothetical protein